MPQVPKIKRNTEILRERLVLSDSLEAIASRHGLNASRVGQIVAKYKTLYLAGKYTKEGLAENNSRVRGRNIQ
jgi:hypothetical protein